MFLHLLALLVASDQNKFDRFERRHYDNNRCYTHYTDSTKTVKLETSFYNDESTGSNYYRECQKIQIAEVDKGIKEIYPYTFYGSSVKTVNFLESADSQLTTIGIGAFAYCNQLTTINLPVNIKYINEGAFFSSAITTPSFSNCKDLISIGNSAYEKSSVRGEISFSGKDDLTTIDNRAFYGTEITKVSGLPNDIAINDYAFAQCTVLTSIPNLVASIGQFAFDGCTALTGAVEVTATSVGKHAFHNTGALQISRISQRKLAGNTVFGIEIDEYAFSGKTIINNIDFSTVTSDSITIKQFAFFKCTFNCASINLERATLGEYSFANTSYAVATKCQLTLNRISSVPKHAFECTSGNPLELQTKGDHLLSTDEFAFYHSHVSTTSNGQLYLSSVGKKAFSHCLNLRGVVNISTTYGSVGAYAFANCTNLAGPVILNCQNVGESAFEFCTSLTSFNMTENHKEGSADLVRTIGDRAFYASGLNFDLLLHSFISEIGEYAFAQCKNLGSRRITVYSRKISPYAFAECGTLNGPITIYSNDIHFHAFDKTTIGTLTIDTKYDQYDPNDQVEFTVHNQAFYGVTFTGPVYIRENVIVSNYAFNRATFANLLLIDAHSIGQYAFAECGASQGCNVSIGETGIGEHAFEFFGRSVAQLKLEFHALVDPANTIGAAAFNTSGFSNDIVIPRYFTSIGSEAFLNVPITSVTINVGDSTSRFTIGSRSFEGSGITRLSITSNGAAVYIDDRAFYGTAINHELIMPVYLSYVGESAFQNSQLRGVVFSYNSNSLYEIADSAFCSCPNLRGEIYIPSHVTKIGKHAFENCTLLNRLTLILDGSLETIDDYAFYGCSSLDNSIDIPYKVTYIGDYAFYNCQRIGDHLSVKTETQYPGTATPSEYCTIGSHAFEKCKALKTLDFVPTHNTNIEDYQKLRYIGSYAFYDSGITGTLYLPYSLYSIGDNAFEGCEISGQLVFHDNLAIIGVSAFENCKGIVHISFDNPSNGDGVELNIGAKAFYHTSVGGKISFANRIYTIGESAFEDCSQLISVEFIDYEGSTPNNLRILSNAFKNTGITGILTIPERMGVKGTDSGYDVGYNSFANCAKISTVVVHGGDFDGFVFENCISINEVNMTGGTLGSYNFVGCQNNITITLYKSSYIGHYAFANYQEGFLYLNLKYVTDNSDLYGSLTSSGFGERAFYNSSLNGSLDFRSSITVIMEEAFAQCKYLLGDLRLSPEVLYNNAFAESVFNGSLYIDFNGFTTKPTTFSQNYFRGSTGFTNLTLIGVISGTQATIGQYAFAGMGFTDGILRIGYDIRSIGKYAFAGCGFYRVDFDYDYSQSNNHRSNDFTLSEGTFYNCDRINTTVDLSQCTFTSNVIPPRVFAGCRRMPFIIFKDPLPTPPPSGSASSLITVGNEAFRDCSSLYIHSDFLLSLQRVGNRAFAGCSSLNGSVYISAYLNHIEEYAFSGCTRFSGSMTIHVDPSTHKYIGPSAFSDCKGFKNGKLYIFVDSNEENEYNTKNQLVDGGFRPYYKYDYFLTIGNEAFEETKFKTVYYNGRFQPECDYDIGFSHTKGIHTSSNYVNKTFCNYPLHSNSLSGGAIAGITIAVIVVVAAIVLLILFLICRNKKNKDNSEDEVEMNADP